MKKIFVDMDGVLTNFNKGYADMFGMTPQEVRATRDIKLYDDNWNKFVDLEGFSSLQWNPGGGRLVEHLNTLNNVQLCILSSAGGFHRHTSVQRQKLQWLDRMEIEWPVVIVPGRKYKSGFAYTLNDIMIDDTSDVITSFKLNGGRGIHHVDIELTLSMLGEML